VPKKLHKKLDQKSEKCYFIGYCENISTYRLYNPITKKIKESREVTFHEVMPLQQGCRLVIEEDVVISTPNATLLETTQKSFFHNQEKNDGICLEVVLSNSTTASTQQEEASSDEVRRQSQSTTINEATAKDAHGGGRVLRSAAQRSTPKHLDNVEFSTKRSQAWLNEALESSFAVDL
jgi:hypothetical protein